MLTILSAVLLMATASCNRGGEPLSETHVVNTSPASLICEAGKTTLSLEVSADAAWQAFASDDCKDWVTGVTPSYSAEPKGTVTITVDENIKKTERAGEIVIKCGTTRHKVSIVQAGYDPGETQYTCPLEGYSLVWHDEFDGGEVNTRNWRFENWNKGWVNNELQYYVAGGEFDGNKTALIDNGVLKIVAMKYSGSAKFNNSTSINGEVISARMNTRESWTYGYFEASIQLPKGKGTWPAFWMMPNDQSLGWPACGEIDIMEEVGVNPDKTSSSVHTKAYNHVQNTQKTAERLTSGAESGFHTYALEWTADYIQTYVDGKKLLRFNNDGKKNNDTWPFNKMFYLTLNLAWGGDWGGMNGVDASALPCTMMVDYVRVYQKD